MTLTVTTDKAVMDPTRGSYSYTQTALARLPKTKQRGRASAGSARAVHEAEAANSRPTETDD